MLLTLAIACLLVIPSVQATGTTGSSPWPGYQGGWTHNGTALVNLSHQWGVVPFKLDVKVQSPMVITPDGGCVFLTDVYHGQAIAKADTYGSSPLYLSDIQNYFEVDSYDCSAPAVLPGGSVIYGMMRAYSSDHVYSLNTSTGWNTSLPVYYLAISQPTVGQDGSVYFFCQTVRDRNYYDVLLALNPDLSQKWWIEKESGSIMKKDHMPSPAVLPDGSALYTTSRGVEQVLPGGSPGWSIETQQEMNSPVVTGNGTALLSTTMGTNITSVNPNGDVMWVHLSDNDISSMPSVLVDGRIAYQSDDGKVYVLNTTGELNMTIDLGYGPGLPQPVAVGNDGIMVTGSSAGKVVAVYPNGTIRWTSRMGEPLTQPIAIGINGIIFVATNRTLQILDPGIGRGVNLRVVEEGQGFYVLEWFFPPDAGDQQVLKYQLYRAAVPAKMGEEYYSTGPSKEEYTLVSSFTSETTRYNDTEVDDAHVYYYEITCEISPGGFTSGMMLRVGEIDQAVGLLTFFFGYVVAFVAGLAAIAFIVVLRLRSRRKG